ncbi:MAG: hypothetical protein Q8Q12_16405 [bacterium]|nr:hypothetical protein [bacterium]
MRRFVRFCQVVLVVTLWHGIGVAVGVAPVSDEAGLPTVGSPVDVAPYGYPLPSEDGKSCGVIWEDPRDIVTVVVTYGENTPAVAVLAAKLQYWQSQWPHRRIPRDRESGAGGSGWLDVGDWYNGHWRDADVDVSISAETATYTFRPLNAKEFPDLKDFNAKYRTTLKLRLLFPQEAPEIKSFRAFSDSTWQREDMDIIWAEKRPVGEAEVEVFNGHVTNPRFLGPPFGSSLIYPAHRPWVWRINGYEGIADAIGATIWYTKSPNVNSFDKTIVTVRAPARSFSFAMDDIVRGERIFIPDYGVLVKKATDAATYESVKAEWEKKKGADVYSRVFEMPEQTFQRTWNAMPERGQHYIVLNCEGSRQHFGVEANGDVFAHVGWLRRIRGKDSGRILWDGNDVRYGFGLPGSKPLNRRILDGCLPIIITEWKEGNVLYRQTAFTAPLEKDILSDEPLQADETIVLLMKVDLENAADTPASATLRVSVSAAGDSPFREKDGLIFTERLGQNIFWMHFDRKGKGSFEPEGQNISYRVEVPARERHSIFIKIPFINLSTDEELARLKELHVEKELPTVAEFWRKRLDAGTQITTPEPWINSFYRAHTGHLLINTEREVGSDRGMAKVGTFHYGVFSNESCMMISDLDRRGYHEKAEKALESFLHYQGTVGLPGDYTSAEGQFYGAGGYEMGGYNQHHGWVLWCMGEHYWYTRDKEWLERSAPKIVKGCDWIIRERKHHMTKCNQPHRAIEKGLLPQGRLEDIGDWWCWLSTNVYSWWGLDNAAKVLKDIGHPEADRLVAEADAYGKDLLAAFNEAMVRSPVVKLRDGSYIPHIPSRVHRRGRSFGWITETLEGAIHLVRTGLLEPWDERSTWIMKDFEDNLYLSNQFGYSVPDFDKYWFDRGGFSMQPSLLCSPIPYLFRDEIKHYVRAYFNSFAVGFFPDTCMLTEHPLPNMGDWTGDHYKASDESNCTFWLRLMFIGEKGDELYLGKAIPRYWMKDGEKISIERAATYFGPMSFEMRSFVNEGRIEMTLDPPTRNAPKAIHVRFRHPDGKPITRVTVNGKLHTNFDPKTEFVHLAPVDEKIGVVVFF